MFFDGFQKYFTEMGKTWLNFSKTRDARDADPAVRDRRTVPKKTQKIAEKSKKRIFSHKKTPPKSVKRHLDGRFLATPGRMSSFAETSSL